MTENATYFIPHAIVTTLETVKVAIVKYNAGNIYSVVNALRRLGVEPVISDNAEILLGADKVLFPGQGEASTAMTYLKKHRLDEIIKEMKQPVLGICIGQQLLCSHSDEGDTDCLGVFPMNVERFRPTNHEYKVPAIGWNRIDFGDEPGSLFKGLDNGAYVYFIHSYYVPVSQWTAATSEYSVPFSAALHKDNFYATQFHPEKSGKTGELILRNFLELKP